MLKRDRAVFIFFSRQANLAITQILTALKATNAQKLIRDTAVSRPKNTELRDIKTVSSTQYKGVLLRGGINPSTGLVIRISLTIICSSGAELAREASAEAKALQSTETRKND